MLSSGQPAGLHVAAPARSPVPVLNRVSDQDLCRSASRIGTEESLAAAAFGCAFASGISIGLLQRSAQRSRRSRPAASRLAAVGREAQHVVVVGGGLGGLNLAVRLAQMPWQGRPVTVTLVDPKDRFVFTPLLVDYAVSDDIALDDFAPKYNDLLKASLEESKTMADVVHRQGRVTTVDLRRRTAVLVAEAGEEETIRFDALVICPGQVRPPAPEGGAETERLPGASSSSIAQPFATLSDAEDLRRRLASPERPKEVSVVGAGYVGAELAAALAADTFASRGAADDVTGDVTLFGGTLLRGCEAPNRQRTQERLDSLGVSICTGRVTAVDDAGVTWLPTGETEPRQRQSDLVLVTGGAADAPEPACRFIGPALGKGSSTSDNRVPVDEFLRAAPGVFFIGDVAAGAPATGQTAMQQADVAAWNVYAQCSGLPRPRWRRFAQGALGEFIALGSGNAAGVVDPVRLTKLLPPALPPAWAALIEPAVTAAGDTLKVAKVDLGGQAAWLMRRLSYLYRMPTIRHRVDVAKRWAEQAKGLGNEEVAAAFDAAAEEVSASAA